MHKSYPKMIASALLALSLVSSNAAPLQGDSGSAGPYCQILDNTPRPLYRAGVSMIGDARVGDFGTTTMTEFEADWEVAYFHDILEGDLGLTMFFDPIFYTDSAEVLLPSHVAELSVNAQWTTRMGDGVAYRIGVKPGIYSDWSDVSADGFAIPFSGAAIYAFNRSVSGMAGLEIRPGWDLPVFPLIGVAWQPMRDVRIDAMLPESRVTWAIDDAWRLHSSIEWRNRDFFVAEKNGVDRGDLTVEDVRLLIGATYALSDQLQFTAEIGEDLGRSLKFEKEITPAEGAPAIPAKLDIESALLLRFSIGGPF